MRLRLRTRYRQRRLINIILQEDQRISIKRSSGYIKITVGSQVFTVSLGNTKVHVPIITTGAALDCPNFNTCPFSMVNNKKTGRKLCYAQKIERLRKNVYSSRLNNQNFILWWNEQEEKLQCEVVNTIQRELANHKYIRLNEAHDMSGDNILFTLALARAFHINNQIVYTYSHSLKYIAIARSEGMVVLHSEHDFVPVKNEAEAEKIGLPVCTSGCGTSCFRCMQGLKTAVIEH